MVSQMSCCAPSCHRNLTRPVLFRYTRRQMRGMGPQAPDLVSELFESRKTYTYTVCLVHRLPILVPETKGPRLPTTVAVVGRLACRGESPERRMTRARPRISPEKQSTDMWGGTCVPRARSTRGGHRSRTDVSKPGSCGVQTQWQHRRIPVRTCLKPESAHVLGTLDVVASTSKIWAHTQRIRTKLAADVGT